MAEEESRNRTGTARVLIIALLAVILVPGLALVAFAVNQALARETESVNVLASSTDSCVSCHRNTSPGIVEQYGHSTMAAANVSCRDCHEVTADYPAAIAHEGTYVLNTPTTAMCQKCHAAEVAQYNQSRHGLPAYVAVAGQEVLSPALQELYASIPEGGYIPDKVRARNAIAALEGEAITQFACESPAGCFVVRPFKTGRRSDHAVCLRNVPQHWQTSRRWFGWGVPEVPHPPRVQPGTGAQA